MKNIYKAQIVYYVGFNKKKFFFIDEDYVAEIFIPCPKYVLAYSKKNAIDKIVYSDLWQYDFAKQKLFEDYGVKDFEVYDKFVRVEEVENKNLRHLVEQMEKNDFLEWLNREGQNA